MKILWFSNCVISEAKPTSTGTWLFTMAKSLVEQGIELYNITQSSSAKDIEESFDFLTGQWILPVYKLKDGLPNKHHIKKIQEIVLQVNPDIIHIWGMESYWGLLSARGYIKGKILLEIQGIKYSCIEAFVGGLSIKEQLKCFKFKEFLVPSISIFGKQNEFKRWGDFEKEMLASHSIISTQSKWVRAWIKPYISSNTEIVSTKISVRDEFLEDKIWSYPENKPISLMCVASCISYKGIHIAIRALAILKKTYPNITLKIAGNFLSNRPFYRISGYMLYLKDLINDLGLKDNVIFLGSLNASEIVEESCKCHAMIHPSFVESYSLALAESMAIGVPSVISHAGAMTELAENNVSGLFYKSDDFHQCAALISSLIENPELCNNISKNAISIGRERNNPSNVVQRQIEIYRKILH
jgi:glycosyltransferase involved in cell wall biosynthesis